MGVLNRWSRRKLETREQDEAAAIPPSDKASTPTQPATELEELDESQQAEVLEQLNLAPPETLQAGDDFSAYLRKEVPLQIRKRALAQLWRSDPILANVDGLVEYGEDFTDAATVVDNLQTAYQVGRGIVLPEAEPEATAEVTSESGSEQPSTDAESESATATEADSADPAPADPPLTESEMAQADGSLPESTTSTEPTSPAFLHRNPAMKFRFDGD